MILTWQGIYTYGEMYPDNIKGTSESFTMEYVVKDGKINGWCTEEKLTHLFEKPATISGFIDGDFISFIKKYPCYFEFDENNMILANKNLPSLEIHYFGNILGDIISGAWEMSFEYKTDDGNWQHVFSSGTWQMKKV